MEILLYTSSKARYNSNVRAAGSRLVGCNDDIMKIDYLEGVMTDTKDKKREKLGILCCTAGATSWGLSGTCSEALFSQYPVDTTWVTAVRMTSAGIILLFLAFAKHSLNLKELGKDKKGLI